MEKICEYCSKPFEKKCKCRELFCEQCKKMSCEFVIVGGENDPEITVHCTICGKIYNNDSDFEKSTSEEEV